MLTGLRQYVDTVGQKVDNLSKPFRFEQISSYEKRDYNEVIISSRLLSAVTCRR